jgi:signal peptidase I
MGAHLAKRPLAAKISLVCHYVLCTAIFGSLALLLLQAVVLETFYIPSGSMAPSLLGHHRMAVCSRCGHEVAVGKRAGETGAPRHDRKVFCPNCGLFPVPMAAAREIAGDQIQVDRSAYLIRSPSRWEIVVFRLLGSVFIKRLLGLPGEELRIHDGDIYVNGKLLRKSLAEARAMRVPIFDQATAPKEVGWKDRWESKPQSSLAQQDGVLSLDGRLSPAMLTYRNFLLNADKCEPIRDEYAYNGGVRADSECVHDFLIETDIEASPGRGSLSLRLCDGRDWVEVVVPIGMSGPVEAFAWPLGMPEKTRKLADTNDHLSLRAGQRYQVELVFVDRRVSLAVDGRTWLSADLPTVKKRAGVQRPFQVRADGVHVSLQRFRLYRDVHYGQQGINAVGGKSVRLAADQYFMLGDNSSNSEDSRFWPDEGRIGASALIGPLLRVMRN